MTLLKKLKDIEIGTTFVCVESGNFVKRTLIDKFDVNRISKQNLGLELRADYSSHILGLTVDGDALCVVTDTEDFFVPEQNMMFCLEDLYRLGYRRGYTHGTQDAKH